jgi:hypothetical protein
MKWENIGKFGKRRRIFFQAELPIFFPIEFLTS